MSDETERCWLCGRTAEEVDVELPSDIIEGTSQDASLDNIMFAWGINPTICSVCHDLISYVASHDPNEVPYTLALQDDEHLQIDERALKRIQAAGDLLEQISTDLSKYQSSLYNIAQIRTAERQANISLDDLEVVMAKLQSVRQNLLEMRGGGDTEPQQGD